jgi:hypothetical protein
MDPLMKPQGNDKVASKKLIRIGQVLVLIKKNLTTLNQTRVHFLTTNNHDLQSLFSFIR